MPKGEIILSIGVGAGWIAAATNLNRLRLFTTGGMQKFVYEMSGAVVSLSGFENLLFVTYHQGVGKEHRNTMCLLF
jgi:chromosome transmission fidelity protein 4